MFQFFELLNFLSENFVFAYIGVSTFTFQQHYWDVPFVFIALFACIVARAANVYPLSALINLCRGYEPVCRSRCVSRQSSEPDRFSSSPPFGQAYSDTVTEPVEATTKITSNFQHMLFFSGLRGAMAFSLAIRNTSSTKRQMFFSTTIVVVMVTVLLCGGLVTTLLNWLRIRWVRLESTSILQCTCLNLPITTIVAYLLTWVYVIEFRRHFGVDWLDM